MMDDSTETGASLHPTASLSNAPPRTEPLAIAKGHRPDDNAPPPKSQSRLRRIAVDYDEVAEDWSLVDVLTEQAHALRSAVLQTQVYLRFSLHDAGARKGTFCLGFTSIVLVVFLTAFLLTTLSHLQIIFLKLAESANGKIDLLVTPGGEFSLANSLNYSVFTSLFPTGPASYHAARIILSLSVFSTTSSCSTFAPNTTALWYPTSLASPTSAVSHCTLEEGNCPAAHCAGAPSVAASVIFLDADREEEIGLTSGGWPYRPGLGEVVISQSIAIGLGLSVGDRILLIGDVSYPLMQCYNTADLDDLGVSGSARLAYTSFPTAVLNATVAYVASNDDEKFESSVNPAFVVGNFDDAVRYVSAGLSPAVSATQRAAFAAVPSAAVASRVYVNLPPNQRNAVYQQRDYASILTKVTQFSSDIFGNIGFNQVDISTPVLDYLSTVSFFSLFLGLIISLILVALAFLSVVLIYSILTVNIQSRTFEMGLQRMLGFTKQNLTGLVLTNAMLFAVPAWVVGLLLALLGYALLRATLNRLLQVTLPSSLSSDAVGFATLAGIGISLFASIAPALDVLTLSLPVALQSDRSRITAVIYKIHSGRTASSFSFSTALLGVAFTAYGFLIYYLFPLALINFNISLLFYIFFVILIAMLAGLILLAVNFERVVETVVSHIFFFWEHDSVFGLIKKNLTAHRPRNRKTTLMYAMSLGFIIFITVAFTIQLRSIEYSDLMSLGGDARYRGVMHWEEFVVFDAALRDQTGPLGSLVRSVTWVSNELKDQRGILNTTMASIGQYVTNTISIIAVPPEFYDVVDSSFVLVGEALSTSYSLSGYLYTIDGSGRGVIATSDKKAMNLGSLSDVFLLITKSSDPTTGADVTVTPRVLSPAAWLDASAVIPMSSLASNAGKNVLVSLPSTVQNSGGRFRSVRDCTFGSFVFRVEEAHLSAVQTLLETLRVDMQAAVLLKDIYSSKSTLALARQIVNVFFIFAEAMAMAICFFSLLTAMSTNVLEQAKEIGILRCIGMLKFPIFRLFTWEAFTLVTSASLLGMLVGIVVAYSMMLQNALFTQIPLQFEFPWPQLVTVLVVALICSVVASYGPMSYLLNLPSITHILRRVL